MLAPPSPSSQPDDDTLLKLFCAIPFPPRSEAAAGRAPMAEHDSPFETAVMWTLAVGSLVISLASIVWVFTPGTA